MRKTILFIVFATSTAARGQVAIPHPDLTPVDPAVRSQIEEIRDRYEILSVDRPESAEVRGALRLLGEHYLAYGFYAAAEVSLSNLALKVHDDARALYLLAYIREYRGKTEEAVATFADVIRIEPDNAPAYLRRGRLLLELGESLPEAEASFVAALEADPACAAARYGRGEVARLRSEWPVAVDHYRAALEMAPDSDQIRYALGIALRQSGRIEEARTQLQQITARVTAGSATWEGCADPVLADIGRLATGVAVHLTRGALAYFDGDLATEVEEYGKAVEADKSDAEARKRHASALLRSGRLDEAVAEYEEAQRLDPLDAIPFFDLAEIRRSQGRLDEAEDLYRAALERNPQLDRALLQLGAIALTEGRPLVQRSSFGKR